MAMSNAERQAAYRKRMRTSLDSNDARLSTVVSIGTKAGLARLARHQGTTQRVVLDRLIADADKAMADSLTGKAQSEYYDGVTE